LLTPYERADGTARGTRIGRHYRHGTAHSHCRHFVDPETRRVAGFAPPHQRYTAGKCTLTPVSQRYLQDLRELALAHACQVHAYVLMTNHVHLLVTPGQSGALARVMQALGRRYVRYINDRYQRTGM